MTSTKNGDVGVALFEEIGIPGFEATWAGPSRDGIHCALGSEDGRIVVVDESGVVRVPPVPISGHREAVNGIAALKDWFAVSTRADFTVVAAAVTDDRLKKTTWPFGAFGVMATRFQQFLAPLGVDGILDIRPGLTFEAKRFFSDQRSINIYALTTTPDHDEDVIVAACRRQGIGFATCSAAGLSADFQLATIDGLDVIDVCTIGDLRFPLAAAALGRDGTIVVVAGPRNGVKRTIKFPSIVGVAYRIFRSGEHMIVLTSVGLFVLPDIVERILAFDDDENAFETPILELPMEAVDANMIGDRSLVVVEADRVVRFHLDAVLSERPNERTSPSTDWRRARSTLNTGSLDLVGSPLESCLAGCD